MRRVLGAMHLALLLPPGCKNLKLVLPYFLVQFKGPTGCALTGNGIYVPASPDFPEGRWIFNEIAFCSNDTRATPLVNLMRQTPALVGASTHHWIDGFKFAAKGASTSYLQAVRFLPPGHELRRQWARSFQLAPARVRAVAQQPAPTRKTHADLVRRGRTVDALPPNDEGKRDRAAALAGVYGVDAFAEAYPGWDSSKHFLDCAGHIVMNNGRDLAGLFGGLAKKIRFNASRQVWLLSHLYIEII
jgi:hypothetical protein